MQNYKENAKQVILQLPFFIMIFFGVIHLGVLVQFNIGGKTMNLGFVNQIVSLLYLCLMYLWALFVNQKRWIRFAAFAMGMLSVICLGISLSDMGKSFNDALCTGSAILTLLYVFENARFLREKIEKYDRLLTWGIWVFVAFSVILFAFFLVKETAWGEGTYLFGHRYASVCGLMTILIALKLLNRPQRAAIYWGLLLLSFAICFWTGARIYVLSGLGTMYAVLYTFNNKDIKRFLIKCVAVTLATFLLFFTSSTVTKVVNIAEDTTQKLQTEAYQQADENYVWVNAMSNGRPNMWKNCWNSYMELPLKNKLLGSGNKYIYDHNNNLNAHTDYLNILHYHGIVGWAIYMFLFVGYVAAYWKKNQLPAILLIGFWGIWFVLAALNGYMSYTANMMSVPYLAVIATDMKYRKEKIER